jgi:zinc/manganese transport system permease protein
MTVSLSPNPFTDLSELVRFPFMVHALAAGAIVAVLAAVVGWYMIVRRQSFAGHSLSVMAFPGAAGAALAGISASLGFYGVCAVAAVAMARAGSSRAGRHLQTAAIGTVQAVGLAAGFLFLSLNTQLLGGLESLAFGTFLGITSGQVLGQLAVALACLAALALIGRPLLFASIDPEGAAAGGVPLAWLDLGFMVILGLAVAATSQITGALLVFSLLVAPAATAQIVTGRPVAGLGLSVVLGLAIVWLALALAYFSPYPVGFYVTSLGFGAYLLARATDALRRRRGRRVT